MPFGSRWAWVPEALSPDVYTVEPLGGSCWSVRGPGDRASTLSVECGWLTLVESPQACAAGWDALESSNPRPGLGLVSDPRSAALVRRTDLYLGHYGDGNEELGRTRVRQVADRFFERPFDSPGAGNPEADRLAEVCREAGVTFTQVDGAPDRIGVEIDRAICRAQVEPVDGGHALWIAIGEAGACAGAVERDAIARLLLGLAGMLRGASPAGALAGDGLSLRFGCWLASEPRDFELIHALGAIASAVRFSAAEVDALAIPAVARAYLAAFDSQPEPTFQEEYP